MARKPKEMYGHFKFLKARLQQDEMDIISSATMHYQLLCTNVGSFTVIIDQWVSSYKTLCAVINAYTALSGAAHASQAQGQDAAATNSNSVESISYLVDVSYRTRVRRVASVPPRFGFGQLLDRIYVGLPMKL